ncbi:MAG: histidine phosphatase family protein [Thermoleophilia bacterium]
MPTTLLIARHGESDWNAEKRWQGQIDRPLTERGLAQAQALADRLDGVPLAAIYASDLRRAYVTADAVARRRGIAVERLPALREVDFGSWAGLVRAEIERRFPGAMQRWLDGGRGWEGGETYAQMSDRVLGALRGIAERHPDGRVLVVAHGGVVRAIHARALGMDYDEYRRRVTFTPNASLSSVEIDAAGAVRPLDLEDGSGWGGLVE